MKKTIVVMVFAASAVAALSLLNAGVAVAQSPAPETPGYGMGIAHGSGEGPLHESMVNALASVLGISPVDFEARRASGKTAYQIALDLGISADKIPALLSGARARAIDAAIAANTITPQQADWLRSHPANMGAGNCSGARVPVGGGMGRSGRWQQNP